MLQPVKRVPNGKTLAVLSPFENLTTLYHSYCEDGTLVDSCQRLKRTLAHDIVVLQRTMRLHAEVIEVGQKQSPCVGITFDFGGQQRRGKNLTAAEYIDALTAVAEHIRPACFGTLELIATTLIAAKAPQRGSELVPVK